MKKRPFRTHARQFGKTIGSGGDAIDYSVICADPAETEFALTLAVHAACARVASFDFSDHPDTSAAIEFRPTKPDGWAVSFVQWRQYEPAPDTTPTPEP